MRKAIVFHNMAKTEVKYIGVFHGFSTEYEELRDGVGQYVVAIIELENGDIVTEPATYVRLVQEANDGNDHGDYTSKEIILKLKTALKPSSRTAVKNVMVHLNGKDKPAFKCSCGCNVFHRIEEGQGQYICNACDTHYVGE